MGQSLDPGGPNKLGSATCPQEVNWRETKQRKTEKGRLFNVATLGRVTEVNCITAPPSPSSGSRFVVYVSRGQ